MSLTPTSTDDLRSQLAERAASNGGEVEQAPRRPATIADLINRQRGEIARALPKHMDADRLTRIALTTIKTTPQLLECTQESLLGALMLSAQTGLEPGPLGHVYFIPRRIKGHMECQWMLGYKGIIDLARRSGQLVSIEAREVCERDDFHYRFGLDEELHHVPFMDGARGPLVAVWGLAKFVGGGHYFTVMSKADIEQARKRSDAGKQNKGPWSTDYIAMARKTVIRRMQPYLPLSPEASNILAQDGSVHTKVQPNMAEEPPAAGWLDVPSWEEPPAGVDAGTGEVAQPDAVDAETAGQAAGADEQEGLFVDGDPGPEEP